MCGVPVHAAESYLARLIRGGHRVAIAEQVESPAEARKARGSKALVDRAIVRLVTPGHADRGGTARIRARANWLAAVGRAGDDWAIAAADISTGRFELVACGPGELAAELARLSPAEIIAAEPVPGIATDRRQGRLRQPRRRARAEGALRGRDARRLRRSVRAELAAAGGLLAYLDATAEGRRRPSSTRRAAIARGRPYGDRRRRPATASRSAASATGSVAGSLLGEVDRCRHRRRRAACSPPISRRR